MTRTEFNLIFWGTMFVYFMIRAFTTVQEDIYLVLNVAVLVGWVWAANERLKAIGKPWGWVLLLFLPYVSILFALFLGVYQPKEVK